MFVSLGLLAAAASQAEAGTVTVEKTFTVRNHTQRSVYLGIVLAKRKGFDAAAGHYEAKVDGKKDGEARIPAQTERQVKVLWQSDDAVAGDFAGGLSFTIEELRGARFLVKGVWQPFNAVQGLFQAKDAYGQTISDLESYTYMNFTHEPYGPKFENKYEVTFVGDLIKIQLK